MDPRPGPGPQPGNPSTVSSASASFSVALSWSEASWETDWVSSWPQAPALRGTQIPSHFPGWFFIPQPPVGSQEAATSVLPEAAAHAWALCARPPPGPHAGRAGGCWEHVPSSRGLGHPEFMKDPCTGSSGGSRVSGCCRLTAPLPGAGLWATGRIFTAQLAPLAGLPPSRSCFLIPTKIGVTSGTVQGPLPLKPSLSSQGPGRAVGSLLIRQEGPRQRPGGLEATALQLTLQTQFGPCFSSSL